MDWTMQQADSIQGMGFLHALVLDGEGRARGVEPGMLPVLDLRPEETLWLHLDRSLPAAQQWLRHSSGLSEFACDLLLEEETRPRLLSTGTEQLLLFLRGVNPNPEAEPGDMISLRIQSSSRRLISLRMRPSRAVQDVVEALESGQGPTNASSLLLALAQNLTERVDTQIGQLSDRLDDLEDTLEEPSPAPNSEQDLIVLRRQTAGLRRYLSPQREIYGQLSRQPQAWLEAEDKAYWNELSNSLTRNLEELEMLRERVLLLQEAGHRRMAERMNRTMYMLAIITGFFLPMSFVTGLLGINVGGIPGSEVPYGFVVACLVIVSIAVSQWWLFRRLGWL